MSKLISEDYRDLNSELHSRNPMYGAKGHKQAANVVTSLGLKAGDVILDYGCGKASLGKELAKQDIDVENYDPALKMYAKPITERKGYPWKYVACMDVIEHVEPNSLNSVLDDLLGSFTTKAFILISTDPSNKTLKDGRNAHLIIQGRNFWGDKLEERGFSVEKLVDNRKGWYGVVCTKR